MNSKIKKSIQVINYFAAKSDGNKINRIKLMKLLWLADRFHLRKYGRPILKDSYCALPLGPVPTITKDLTYPGDSDGYVNAFLKKSTYSVESISETDMSFLSKTDAEVIDIVWNEFGGYNHWYLVDLSHEYPEWKEHEHNISKSGTKDSYPMSFESFFSNPESKDGIHANFFELDKDIIQCARAGYINSLSVIDILNKA